MDLLRIRRRLDGEPARQWRSLDELAETGEFREMLHREFPENASEWLDPAGRREFLRLMGASLALAGLTACTRQPSEAIVPYVRAPEEIVPGQPLYFATAMTLGGLAQGILVESHMGRPTKVEGNPRHPASLGSTDHFAQASVLSLYDPDRSQVVQKQGTISTWPAFSNDLAVEMQRLTASKGEGLRILTGAVTSPTLAALIQELLARFPGARWHQYEPAGQDAVRQGSLLAFGEPVNTVYQLDQADVIVALGADLMACMAGSVRYARDISARRRAEAAGSGMNRLYVVESVPSPTGTTADHRLALAPRDIGLFALDLAAELGLPAQRSGGSPRWAPWVSALARDLQRARGRCAVVPGPWQPPEVHALAHAINEHLGNHGTTVRHTDPVEARSEDHGASLGALVSDMQAGSVKDLFILGGNPAWTSPAGIPFAAALKTVPFTAHLSQHEDETSAACLWHLPETHFLETWGDARAFDGTVTIQQPLIAPLYTGKSALEILSLLLGRATASPYDIVRAHWQPRAPAGGLDLFWRRSLNDGLVEGSQLPARTVRVRREALGGADSWLRHDSGALNVVFQPDPCVWDGLFSNNTWLQELPRPLTLLTWGNAATLSPATAERLGVANEDVVELTLEGRTIAAPVWILPGMAEDTVGLTLGYGREKGGRAGTGHGYDAYPLLPAALHALHSGARAVSVGRREPLATTQMHFSMEGRPLVRWAPLATYEKTPDFARHAGHGGEPQGSLYPQWHYDSYAWGMAIDLGACHGCNACMVACQSENNIPVVGKEQVMRGREMHWIRVDRYYEGNLDNPIIHSQPVPCMHCENAPCEPVCPVGATVHSSEGLNQMVYNRCVGTRYCSNNCPYKVRRFNFLLYQDWETPSLKPMRNPDVTVRSRGVMEKCTYCVQRINAARIQAKNEDRRIRDGEVVPACAGACPTQAIAFGDINDPESRVFRLRNTPLNYGLLEDLNTRPRTTYLARVMNTNPELAEWDGRTPAGHEGERHG